MPGSSSTRIQAELGLPWALTQLRIELFESTERTLP